jgi:hypothetical protein
LPDPHLGLARVYVYGLHNAGQAVAEFHAAERLGFRPGPREAEQQADAYLYRAEREMAAWQRVSSKATEARYLTLAQHDFERARNLYEPIAGFSNVSQNLKRLNQDEDLMRKTGADRESARLRSEKRRSQPEHQIRWP